MARTAKEQTWLDPGGKSTPAFPPGSRIWNRCRFWTVGYPTAQLRYRSTGVPEYRSGWRRVSLQGSPYLVRRGLGTLAPVGGCRLRPTHPTHVTHPNQPRLPNRLGDSCSRAGDSGRARGRAPGASWGLLGHSRPPIPVEQRPDALLFVRDRQRRLRRRSCLLTRPEGGGNLTAFP